MRIRTLLATVAIVALGGAAAPAVAAPDCYPSGRPVICFGDYDQCEGTVAICLDEPWR